MKKALVFCWNVQLSKVQFISKLKDLKKICLRNDTAFVPCWIWLIALRGVNSSAGRWCSRWVHTRGYSWCIHRCGAKKIWFLILEHVLRVDLRFVKHNINGGIVNIVNATVIEMDVPSILGRGPSVIWGSLSVFSHQQSYNKHGHDVSVAGVAVWVLGILGKIAAYIWAHEDISISVM